MNNSTAKMITKLGLTKEKRQNILSECKAIIDDPELVDKDTYNKVQSVYRALIEFDKK